MQSKALTVNQRLSSLITWGLALSCLLVLFSGLSLAVDPPSQNQEAEIGKTIELLKSGRFNEREAASRKLAQFGRAAIAPLAEAAMGNQREVTMRAINILKKYLGSSDEQTRDAAKQALEQIAAGPQVTAARQAEQVLNPPPPPEPEVPPAGRIRALGPVQIRVQVGGAGNQRIRIKQVNGTKEIEAEENGRKVTIKEDVKNGIKMEVTEKKDGKETTKKYEAKDVDDLAKKHPAAHQLYKKYTKPPNLKIQLPNLQQAIPLIPGQNQLPPIPNLQLPRGPIPPQATRSLQQAHQELNKSIQQLEEASKQLKLDTKDADRLRTILDQLKATQKKLDRAQSQLGGPQK